jgi:hypothetical protein
VRRANDERTHRTDRATHGDGRNQWSKHGGPPQSATGPPRATLRTPLPIGNARPACEQTIYGQFTASDPCV